MATKITITLSCVKEDETPEQSERRTRSMEGYAKAVRAIMKTAQGSWGWCVAVVKVKLGDKEGISYLGNCSYKSAEDFAIHSGYLDTMINDAIEDCN